MHLARIKRNLCMFCRVRARIFRVELQMNPLSQCRAYARMKDRMQRGRVSSGLLQCQKLHFMRGWLKCVLD